MTISAADCRQFIADFHGRNPQIEQARFGGNQDSEDMAILSHEKA